MVVVVVPPVQAGFYQTMVMVFVGYSVVILTVLSISAIATSSTVEGGGVYCILLSYRLLLLPLVYYTLWPL